MPHTPILRLERVTKSFDRRLILPEFSLTVDSGDFIAVTGPNGGGKTTLLRLMLGLTKPSSGSVTCLDGDRRVKYLPIGYLPQKSSIDSRFPVTVGQVVTSGLLKPPGCRDRSSERDAMETVLEVCGLTDLADHTIGSLSGGQLQRALLARALVSAPKVLMLDEPLSYLDTRFSDRLYEILASLRGLATVIVVSHQMEGLEPLMTRRLQIDHRVEEISVI